MPQVAVIGRGLIGSAAARHLAESGHSVALIGPPEPAVRQSWTGPFSSHPDEGRITRIAGRSPVWSVLAARSIERYADIERRSGVKFHHPRGLATVFPNAEEWLDHGRAAGSDVELVTADWLEETTGIHLTNGLPVAFEGPPAGHINPRRLVEAQGRLAAAEGAEIIRETVNRIERRAGAFEIGGQFGTIRADRIVVATGAFGADLLGARLDVVRFPRTVVMAEIADNGRIPSLISDQPPDDRLAEIYWVPPIRFPDGRVCLKIGGELVDAQPCEPEDLTDWFHSEGSEVEADALSNCVRALLPGVQAASWWQTPCVVTSTPNSHPYIGWVDEGIAVAIGGNGSAAKSSDELGRLAASLVAEGEWADDLPADVFAPAFL